MTTASPLGEFTGFAPPPQQKRNDELGQSDFLKLMITQFQNQDPFQPMENGEFLGQLAQFSTVSGIDSLNSSFAGLANSVQGEQALQAANLVGRKVMAVSDVGYLSDSGSINGVVELANSASEVQVDIRSESGELIKTITLGQQPAGIVRFSWDGTNASGERLEPGQYRIAARVVRGAEVESTATAIEANIESVTLGQFGSGMLLNLSGGGTLSLAQVYQIS